MMSMSFRQIQAYHTANPDAVHLPVHGGITVYARIPNFGGSYVGTLSGVVIDKTTKKKYLLSNQHVFFPYQSGSSAVKPGLLLYNPSQPTVPIGRTLRTKAENNPWPEPKTKAATDAILAKIGTYHDSALAEPLVPVSMEVNNIGVQKSVVEAKKGMRIKYFGNKSRLQRGVITNPSTNTGIKVGSGKMSIQKNIIYSDVKSGPGDSGSMVFTEDNHVIGLLYATQSDVVGGPATTAICKASAIANAYNVVFSEEEAGIVTPTPTPTPSPTPTPTTTFDVDAFLKQEVTFGGLKLPMLVVLGGMGIGLVGLLGLSALASK